MCLDGAHLQQTVQVIGLEFSARMLAFMLPIWNGMDPMDERELRKTVRRQDQFVIISINPFSTGSSTSDTFIPTLGVPLKDGVSSTER